MQSIYTAEVNLEIDDLPIDEMLYIRRSMPMLMLTTSASSYGYMYEES